MRIMKELEELEKSYRVNKKEENMSSFTYDPRQTLKELLAKERNRYISDNRKIIRDYRKNWVKRS